MTWPNATSALKARSKKIPERMMNEWTRMWDERGDRTRKMPDLWETVCRLSSVLSFSSIPICRPDSSGDHAVSNRAHPFIVMFGQRHRLGLSDFDT